LHCTDLLQEIEKIERRDYSTQLGYHHRIHVLVHQEPFTGSLWRKIALGHPGAVARLLRQLK
jgi:hypothetical protein